MQLQVFPLVGLPQFNGWSQVLLEHDQRLVCALGVEGQNAGNIGRDLVLHLSQADLRSATDFYQVLQELEKITRELEVKLLVSAVFIEGEDSFFATFNGSIILKRETKIGTLLASNQTLRMIQGSVEVHDVIVLSTNAAQPYLGELQQKVSQGYEAETIMNSMVPAIHEDPSSASISLAFLTLPEATTLQPMVESHTTQSHSSSQTTLSLLMPKPVVEPQQSDPKISSQPDFPQELPTLQPDTQTVAVVTTAHKAFKPWRQRVRELHTQLWKLSRHLKPILGWVQRASLSGVHQLQKHWKNTRKKSFLSSEVYISSGSRVPWRTTLVVLVVVVAAFVGVAFWQLRRTRHVSAAQAALEPLTARFEEAENQVPLKPVEARTELRAILAEVDGVKNSFLGQPAGLQVVTSQFQALQARYDALSGKAEFSELPVFFDLTSVQPGFVATQVASDGVTAVFIDGENKQAIQFTLQDWQPTQFAVDQESTVTDAAVQSSQLLVLGEGVTSFDLTQGNLTSSQLISEGDSNRDATLVASFSDYLYVLNPSKRNVFRYLRSQESVSEPIGWLKPGQDVVFDEVSSLKVDGDVWLGTRKGEVIKLSLGERTDFQVTGLSEPLSGPLVVDTQPEWQNVYILEANTRRVVVLKKDGSFLKEIKSASLASATHLIADEVRNRVFAVSGSVIFEVKL